VVPAFAEDTFGGLEQSLEVSFAVAEAAGR
jgi:hypothetical protein